MHLHNLYEPTIFSTFILISLIVLSITHSMINLHSKIFKIDKLHYLLLINRTAFWNFLTCIANVSFLCNSSFLKKPNHSPLLLKFNE